jgi:alpha,alpha-trehalase
VEGVGIDALLVDLDGVVTRTAKVHAEAWKRMFDEFLDEREAREGEDRRPFDLERDYRRYVDGRPRYDGVEAFLRSRGIELPRGREDDGAGTETVCGLGNAKNALFLETVRDKGVDVYADAVALLTKARDLGLRLAVVTSSRNGREIVEAAGVAELFEARVDGVTAAEAGLAGKPAPDIFLAAAAKLGVTPARAAVLEDAEAGVEAGRAGHFGLVVGVARGTDARGLERHGADVVVTDLESLSLEPGENAGPRLPRALDALEAIRGRIGDRRLALFLDYDGTLTPIVERPEDAVLSDEMRATLEALAERCAVVVISGRELSDVRERVGVPSIVYAGSHGFAIAGPPGTDITHEQGEKFVPAIERAARSLTERLAAIDGVLVENKRYAIAVHYRRVAETRVPDVEAAVEEVRALERGLKQTGGKKVIELRPDIDWDKGRAVQWLLDRLDLDRGDVEPIYIGDDVTDYDAFEALGSEGIGILVAEEAEAVGADYLLHDVDDVRVFLEALIRTLDGRD